MNKIRNKETMATEENLDEIDIKILSSCCSRTPDSP